MNKIKIEVNNTITCLIGNNYGYEIYVQQIKNYLKEDKNIIVFPDSIERVAISFVQGLFRELLSKYGKEEIFNHIDIEAKNEKIKNKIIESIKF